MSDWCFATSDRFSSVVSTACWKTTLLILENYIIKNIERESLGITTYRGVDSRTAQPVVIKAAAHTVLTPSMTARFDKEVTSMLRDGPIPNTNTVSETISTENAFIWISPWLTTPTVHTELKNGPLNANELLHLAESLLVAMEEMHSRGVLHRDIKPYNIWRKGNGAVLGDFGPSRSQVSLQDAYDLSADMVRYLSPEQAGLLRQRVDERSDLYSLGLVLHECATGTPAFCSNDVTTVLRQQLTSMPKSILPFGDSPRHLDSVVKRLLQKDPRDRYQSATGALADIRLIRETHSSRKTAAVLTIGAKDQRTNLTEATFVGRDQEFNALATELDKATKGMGSLTLVCGTSGVGKSRFLEEFERFAIAQGLWVLSGSAVNGGGSPLQLFADVFRTIQRRLLEDGAFQDRMRDELSPYRQALQVIAPDVVCALGINSDARTSTKTEEPQSPDPTHGETRIVNAVSTMLLALGTQESPVVLLLDDCQWADELALKVLAAYQVETSGTHPSTLRYGHCVVGERTERDMGQNLAGKLGVQRTIPLLPLAEGDVAQLLESMAGPLPEEARLRILSLSNGNPFMAGAVLHGLVEVKALVSTPDGWQINESQMDAVSSSNKAGALLATRISTLAAGTQRFLTWGAVLGHRFSVDLVRSLTAQTPKEVLAALDEALERQLIWTDARAEDCSFVHARIRETLLDVLSEETLSALHGLAAEAMEQRHPERIYELSRHFDAASEPEKALPYAIRAGEQAKEKFGLNIAEQHFRIALKCPNLADDLAQIVHTGLGDVFHMSGEFEDAVVHFERALSLCRKPVERSTLRGKIGNARFSQGRMAEATQALEQGLYDLGVRVPRSTVGLVIALAFQVLVQVLHTYLPRMFLARRSRNGSDKEFATIRLLERLQYPYYFSKGAVPTFWVHLRLLNLAECFPKSRDLGLAYAGHGVALATVPMFRRAVRYGRRGVNILQSENEPWARGIALHYLGVALYAATEYEECAKVSSEAAVILERSGDLWFAANSLRHVVRGLLALGKRKEALEKTQHILDMSPERGGHSAGVLLELAILTGGEFSQDLLTVGAQDDVLLQIHLLEARGRWHLGHEQPAEAVELLLEAKRLARDAKQRGAYVASVPVVLASAMRAQAEAVPTWDVHERNRLMLKARKAAQVALKTARTFPTQLAQALREAALVEAYMGHSNRAQRFIEESISVATSQHAAWERAKSQLVRGTLGQCNNWPNAEKDLIEGKRSLRRLGLETHINHTSDQLPSLSLADRFQSLLHVGKKIAVELVPKAIFDEVERASSSLLRGEVCVVVPVIDGCAHLPDDIPWSDTEKESYTAYLQLAIRQGNTIIGSDSFPKQDLPAIAGSVLCTPIRLRAQTVGCLCATHKRLTDLFGTAEVRISDFLGTLASAALQNAESFASVEELSKDLERQVAQRTNELDQKVHELIDIRDRLLEAEKVAVAERERSDELLLNVLPAPIAERLKQREHPIADTHAEACVLFADIVGFTELSTGLSATKLVSFLNEVFAEFDRLTRLYKLEKIKTIGDAYMAVGGIPHPRPDIVRKTASMALEMMDAFYCLPTPDGTPLGLRIGLHVGPVVAGVIGLNKFSYDVWGDTVNVAARMESHSEPGCVHMSEAFALALGEDWERTERETIFVKGKGQMRTYWLRGPAVPKARHVDVVPRPPARDTIAPD